MGYGNKRREYDRGLDVWLLSLIIVFAVLLVLPKGSIGADESKGAAVDLVTAIQKVAQDNIPAVVHIEVTERQEIANPFLPFENDPFFKYFFGNPNMPKKFQRELVGLGSGMLMDNEGRILTNNHVVGGATKIQVLLADGRRFTEKSIKFVGTDPKTDLAVIQILEKGPFPHVTFGDSDKMGVGQWVVAIGHPRGLDQTVTQGIISAKHRRGISDPSSYQDFLQTDAAINPGNSGGPLLNLQGEVIGINAAIASESGGSEGIGFAIPSAMAVHVAKELIANGKVIRGWLGVNSQDLTPELAQSFGLSTVKGALVADVEKGSPGEAAGLKRGDIITAFQGQQIDDAPAFRNAVAVASIGEEVKVTVLRDGKKLDMVAKIGSQEEQDKKLALSLWERLGADVRAITSKDMDKFGLESQQGVVIDKVDPKGPLGKAGFEKGDLILQVNNYAVEGPEDLATQLRSLPSRQKIVVLVVDHKSGDSGYVQVVLR